MSDSPGDASSKPSASAPGEEVDLWWGSYSPWTMWPSFGVCLLLTVLNSLAARWLVPREWVQVTVLGLGGLLWFIQMYRWGYRVFGCNYRLTTRRLFQDRGPLHPNTLRVDLTGIAQVIPRKNSLERLVDIGQIHITLADRAGTPLLLNGVRHPNHIVGLIRQAVHKARQVAPQVADWPG